MSHIPGFLQGRTRLIFVFTPNLGHLSQSSRSGNKPTIQKLFLGFGVWNCSFSLTWEYDVATLEPSSLPAMYLLPKDPTRRLSQVSVPPLTPMGLPSTGPEVSLSKVSKHQRNRAAENLKPSVRTAPEWKPNQVFKLQKQNK